MVHEILKPIDDAQAPMAAGPLHWLRAGELEVAIAPEAGGRIAQIKYEGVEWLVGPNDGTPAAIAWGCYPMVPWAGRIRRGHFSFDGKAYSLPPNLGGHSIHGVGFSRPWQVDSITTDSAKLSLVLPQDAYWAFGGIVRQSILLGSQSLRLHLALRANERAMPAVLGWHPWFRKPDRLLFEPSAMYPRDEEGIAVRPLVQATSGPWDDCFIHQGEVVLEAAGQRLLLRANTDHWVIYDDTLHATCVEPQSGPPDGFTLAPRPLVAGEWLELSFEMRWGQAQ